jgi:hypothetical protein
MKGGFGSELALEVLRTKGREGSTPAERERPVRRSAGNGGSWRDRAGRRMGSDYTAIERSTSQSGGEQSFNDDQWTRRRGLRHGWGYAPGDDRSYPTRLHALFPFHRTKLEAKIASAFCYGLLT